MSSDFPEQFHCEDSPQTAQAGSSLTQTEARNGLRAAMTAVRTVPRLSDEGAGVCHVQDPGVHTETYRNMCMDARAPQKQMTERENMTDHNGNHMLERAEEQKRKIKIQVYVQQTGTV